MKKLLAFVFIVALSGLFNLHPVFGQRPTHPTKPNKGIPIDGGASWLAAAGAAYGIKKYRDSRKRRQQEEN